MPTKPQDHKTKTAKVQEPSDTPGWNLLQNFADVPVWDQTPLLALLQQAFESEEDLSKEELAELSPEERKAHNEGKVKHKSVDVNIIGELSKALLPYAHSQEEYTKFLSGPGAIERAANLAMAWVGQMGESKSSETS